MDTSEDPVTSDILFVLQLRISNKYFLPNLRIFECDHATEAFIPFIPSFLSRTTTDITIKFAQGSSTVMVASMITRLSILCPSLECINLNHLPRDPVITEAVSEMLLACDRDALRWFQVDSPLTEEAREVVCQLSNLSELWTVIEGHTRLPTVTLPNLVSIDIEYDGHLDWLQGFRGATLGTLEAAYFNSRSEPIGDFLGEFESVARTTSALATLSAFKFSTSQPWNPNYRSLLPFTQLKELAIKFSCDDSCSSRVDDNIIMDLARAMPKLEILQLGGKPCETIGGVTVKGLIALSRGCRHLSKLRIHFQSTSLVEAATGIGTPAPSDEVAVRRQGCVLTDLVVGEIPIPVQSAWTVTLTLLQIFPRLLNIEFIDPKWENVAENIRIVKQIGTFVHCTGKPPLPYL